MKKLLSFFLASFACSAFGAILPPPPATQAEVNAGVNSYKYVTPRTLVGYINAGTNGFVTNGATYSLFFADVTITNATYIDSLTAASLYVPYTNAAGLATDGDGKVIAGASANAYIASSLGRGTNNGLLNPVTLYDLAGSANGGYRTNYLITDLMREDVVLGSGANGHRFAVQFSDTAGDAAYGSWFINSTHGGAASPQNSETIFSNSRNVAWGIGQYNHAGGHIQWGIEDSLLNTNYGGLWMYRQSAIAMSALTDQLLSYSGADTWKTQWRSNGVLFTVHPGLFGQAQNTNGDWALNIVGNLFTDSISTAEATDQWRPDTANTMGRFRSQTGTNRFEWYGDANISSNLIAANFTGNGGGITNVATSNLVGTVWGGISNNPSVANGTNVIIRNDSTIFHNGSLNTMAITGGKVGIGTNSPVLPLSLVSPSSGSGLVYLRNTSADGYTAFDMYDSSGVYAGGFGYANPSAAALSGSLFLSSSSKDIIITKDAGSSKSLMVNGTTGNVGIGTTAPVGKLDVNGALNATSVNVTNAVTAGTFTGNGGGLTNVGFNNSNPLNIGSWSINTNASGALNVSNTVYAAKILIGTNGSVTTDGGVTNTANASGTLVSTANTYIKGLLDINNFDGNLQLQGLSSPISRFRFTTTASGPNIEFASSGTKPVIFSSGIAFSQPNGGNGGNSASTTITWKESGTVLVDTNLIASGTITATNGFIRIDTSTFATNSVPPGSATKTNTLDIVYKGIPMTVATNYAVGGWMRWRTADETWQTFTP